MVCTGLEDLGQSRLTPLSEQQFADWRREQGRHIVCHRGRYWEEIRRGFYSPVHWLAHLSAAEATRPAWLCWGFRAVLSDAAAANGTLPIHVLSDVRQFDIGALGGKPRGQFRKCRKLVAIGRPRDPSLLYAQGHAVVESACRRTGHAVPPSLGQYRAGLERYVADRRRFILVGMVDDKLAGYLVGYAVETIAYIDVVYVHSDLRSTAVGTGLYLDFIESCRNSSLIRSVVAGLHSIEDANLCRFKEGMGFPVCQVPSLVWMAAPCEWLLRRRYPQKLYRLTGIRRAGAEMRRET